VTNFNPLGTRGQITALGNSGASLITLVDQPSASFSFLPFSVYKTGGTFNVGSWEIADQVPKTTVRYVNKSGSDTTGDGTSVASAWKTLTKAWTTLNATDNACVYVGAGTYGWSDGGFNDTTWGRTGRSLVATGNVVLDSYLTCTFALSAGQTYTYEAIQANPINAVLDYGTLDSNGDPTAYVAKSSIAEVEALAGSYYYKNTVTKTLYVHTLENNTPDVDVRPQYSGNFSIKITVSNLTAYMEGIKCYHTAINVVNNASPNTGILYFKNCRWMHNSTILKVNGYTAYFKGCQWAHSISGIDGLISDVANTVVAKICTIDCTSWDFGVTGDTTMNCLTNHNGGINVVINGEYSLANGGNIACIGSGAAWLLGVNSHDCALGSGINDDNYQFQENAWLDTCTSSGSTYDISVDTGHTIYIRNFSGEGHYYGAGTVTAY
jgi:hypothetical protein